MSLLLHSLCCDGERLGMTRKEEKVNSYVSGQSRERTERRTEKRSLMRGLLSVCLRGKRHFPRLQLFSKFQNYVLEIIDLLGMHNSSARSMFCVHMRGVWEGLYLSLFSRSPISSPYESRSSCAGIQLHPWMDHSLLQVHLGM